MRQQEIAGYHDRGGARHRIELVDDGIERRLVDRDETAATTALIAELDADEDIEQILAVLQGDGAYLERARSGERGLCKITADNDADDAAWAA